MALKIFSGKFSFRPCWFLVIIIGLAAFSGCAGMQPVAERPVEAGLPAPENVDSGGSNGQGGDYRTAASHSLTMEGYRLIQSGNFNGAIRVLERAVGVNPGDGQGYFYLAEAWIGKNALTQASRFNEMAIMYLRDNPVWLQRARAQKKRIEKQKNIE